MVNELQSIKLQCLQDNQTQTCKELTDDLAFFTCATLDEIAKELKRRGCSRKGETDSEFFEYGLLDADARNEEILRLQKELDDMKKERDTLCTDASKRLQELDEENAKLLNENRHIKDLMKDGEEKMANMLRRMDNFDGELNQNGEELKTTINDLTLTKKLVEDISSMHLENQQLANAVVAINTRDDEKIIDDLRRQLEEEIAKLNKCQLDNVAILKRAEEAEFKVKSLKDELHRQQSINDGLMNKYKKNEEAGGEALEKLHKGNNNKNVHIDPFIHTP